MLIVNYKYKFSEDEIVVNTTSRSSNWSINLSPFKLGPIDLYGSYISQNVENGWQFSKVYGHLDHVDENDCPTDSYFKWAEKGWNDTFAHRYPMGKGVRPLFSYWDGKKLSYAKAREEIYIPLYAKAVQKTEAFKKLKEIYEDCRLSNKQLYLIDFDAHNIELHSAADYQKLWNNEQIKVGHAYVLGMLLEGYL